MRQNLYATLAERDEPAFFSLLNEMAAEVKKRDDFAVVHHYDADGISSGAVVIKALEREGKRVEHLCLKQLYREDISRIRKLGKNYLFVDFGSGQLDYLVPELGNNLFVLDHHQPVTSGGNAFSLRWHTNPLLFGIDGGSEISGAGVAFFFALALNEKNIDLAGLGIVGALGDMQDLGLAREFIGLNKKILSIAQKEKIIQSKKDISLYGRISRPLVSFLAYASSPMLPGLTANEEQCIAFLKENDIPLRDPITETWLSYEDLDSGQKKRLTSALIMHLVEQKVPEWKVQELLGETYTLLKEAPRSPLRDGKEFATLLNACGRHKKPEIGLAICLGDRNPSGEYGRAVAMLDEHRLALRKGIEFVREHGVEERKSFYFFDAGLAIEESLVGIIAGMLYGSIISENKPIIALARNQDGTIKVSGRGTSDLVRRGLNIGRALKEISQEIDGMEGGGHQIAAGAKLPAEQLEKFLSALEEKFSKQLNLL